MPAQVDPQVLPGALLAAVESDRETDGIRARLAVLDRERLRTVLDGRAERTAFWLNCYNGYLQLLLEENPDVLSSWSIERWKFREREQVPIAGTWLSLNDIAHGLLRCSRHPLGLGYLPRLLPSSFERAFRVSRPYPLVGLALGDLAGRCPPIVVYESRTIEGQIADAARWYLRETVTYDPETDRVAVPRRLLWFLGDLGGADGIVELLQRFDVVPDDERPAVEFRSIDPVVEPVPVLE